MQWIEQTAGQLLGALESGAVTSVELCSAFLSAIRVRDPITKAYLRIDDALVLEQARAVDEKRESRAPLGALAGLPIAIKDVICTAGQKTTCGSKILGDFTPPYDAHVCQRLRAADAILLGKTNLDEFAMGSSTENSAFHVTRNPWNPNCIPGGSSGGSAAAVAAGMAPLALGTDTGGSIRQPASHCGVVGLKPTYGRVSRFGLVAFASSLDQIGPLSRNVADAALLLGVIAGHDSRDSTSVAAAVPDYLRILEQAVQPLTIGVVKEHFGAGLDPEVESAVRADLSVYERLGARIVEVSLPHSPFAVAVYYLIATAEASSNLARYDGAHYGRRAPEYGNLVDMYCRSRGQGFGAEVKRRIMLGTFTLSTGYKDAYYLKAAKVRRLIRRDFDEAFAQCDVLMGPVAPTPAFYLGEKIDDPLAMYLSDIYTISSNLAGICGMSIPGGFSEAGLPIGLHIQAAPFAEDKLFRVARMFERETDWHRRRPKFSQ